jgi:AcrR family transcriptional regulator
MDRRVAKTLALLQHAHLAMIVEKGYDAVTVEDICARAKVGRSTFYAHFTGKEDLHRRGLEALRHELTGPGHAAGRAQAGAPGLAFSLPMFEHARAHLDLYRALTGSRGGVVAMESIRQLLCDAVRAELPATAALPPPAPPRELVVQHVVGAYLAILTWWLDTGATIPASEMDAMFQRLMRQGLPA